MNKDNSELKRLAQSAKNRLKKGYWQGATAEESVPSRANSEIGYAAEEELYAKVREMLSADECVIDPIGRLIDQKRFCGMDSSEKSRYVFELAKTYARLKDRYYREKSRRRIETPVTPLAALRAEF